MYKKKVDNLLFLPLYQILVTYPGNICLNEWYKFSNY